MNRIDKLATERNVVIYIFRVHWYWLSDNSQLPLSSRGRFSLSCKERYDFEVVWRDPWEYFLVGFTVWRLFQAPQWSRWRSSSPTIRSWSSQRPHVHSVSKSNSFLTVSKSSTRFLNWIKKVGVKNWAINTKKKACVGLIEHVIIFFSVIAVLSKAFYESVRIDFIN